MHGVAPHRRRPVFLLAPHQPQTHGTRCNIWRWWWLGSRHHHRADGRTSGQCHSDRGRIARVQQRQQPALPWPLCTSMKPRRRGRRGTRSDSNDTYRLHPPVGVATSPPTGTARRRGSWPTHRPCTRRAHRDPTCGPRGRVPLRPRSRRRHRLRRWGAQCTHLSSHGLHF